MKKLEIGDTAGSSRSDPCRGMSGSCSTTVLRARPCSYRPLAPPLCPAHQVGASASFPTQGGKGAGAPFSIQRTSIHLHVESGTGPSLLGFIPIVAAARRTYLLVDGLESVRVSLLLS
jgi:hypothetical protein